MKFMRNFVELFWLVRKFNERARAHTHTHTHVLHDKFLSWFFVKENYVKFVYDLRRIVNVISRFFNRKGKQYYWWMGGRIIIISFDNCHKLTGTPAERPQNTLSVCVCVCVCLCIIPLPHMFLRRVSSHRNTFAFFVLVVSRPHVRTALTWGKQATRIFCFYLRLCLKTVKQKYKEFSLSECTYYPHVHFKIFLALCFEVHVKWSPG
jgi:hypothetical protein